MNCLITTFAHRGVNITLVAVCLTAVFAEGRAARAQDFFQEGGSRLYISRTLDPDGEDAATSGDMLAADGPQRSPIPTVGMDGDTLVINGVAGAHDVYIIGVEGNPGAMTVHFDDWPMKLFFDVTHIDINFVGGPNFLALLQVGVEGDVEISAGDGDNQFYLGYHNYGPNLIGGNLSVLCGHGANDILFEESWVLGNADFVMGDGGNDLTIGLAASPSDLGAVVLGELFVGTGTGHDKVEIVKSWLGDDTLIETAGGDDTVILGTHYATGSAIAGNVIGGDLDVLTGAGDDGLGLTDNEVYGRVDIALEDDDDVLLIGGSGFLPNDFYDHFTAHGGGGADFLDDDPGNFYAHSPHFQSF